MILVNMKSISMHQLLLMIVMLDCHWFHRILSNGQQAKKNKIKSNICIHRESNQRPLAFQHGALDHSATWTVKEL